MEEETAATDEAGPGSTDGDEVAEEHETTRRGAKAGRNG